MINAITLLIPGDTNNLSPNQHLHWRERRRREEVWRTLAVVAWMQAGAPRWTRTVRISFVVYRGRKIDEDNLCASTALQAVVNALKGRALIDDSPRYVQRGTVTQETGERYRKRPAVLVTIEPLDEKEAEGG